ncbi:MAG: OmpH family outer membrane protein [Acidiphilium sp.]|nr:OmpH family outer membrane protein [Acidiphilium sp.]MDD4936835.1 OmpH family outer membrane protein [Acidiphilium sp.]
MKFSSSLRLGLTLPALALGLGIGHAQSNGPGYFIPHPKAAPASHTAPMRAAAPAMPEQPGMAQNGEQPGTQAIPQQKLPPIPQLPALPKENTPPAPVMGVLSVPEVMQESTAAQGVEKIIEARRQKLAAEAQADQQKWEGEQKTITGEKAKLSKAALAGKEQALQTEIEQAQVDFHNRNLAIEVAARTALGKIEATLIAVIRQVAQAHGMNLVLHRSQVALNVNGFDISKEVAGHLNKILPSVAVPPSVVPNMAAASAQK